MKKAILLLILAGACSPQDQHEASKAAIEGAVRQTLNDYYDDVRRNGLLAEFGYLDSTAAFFWVPPGYDRPLTYDDVSAAIKKNAGLYQSVDNVINQLKVVVLSPELASYTARIQSAMTDATGRIDRFMLIETGVVIKRTTGWKLLNGQTAVLPEQTTAKQ